MSDRVNELIEKLGSSDRNVVKATVIDELAKIQDPRAVKPLIEALNDAEMLVRWNAIKALARYSDLAVIPLLKALDSDDRFKRRNIVQALGEVGGDEVVDRLIRMLMFDETDPMVQIEIIRALDKIGDARAVDPLITVLKMSDWEMRFRAVRALERLSDPRAVESLLEVMNDSDKDIKWAAYNAVEAIKAAAAQDQPQPKPFVRESAAKRNPAELKMMAEQRQDGIVVYVEGELLYENIESFMGYMDGVMSLSRGEVELSLSLCTFIDSFALAKLNILRKKLKSKNRILVLSGMSSNVHSVFAATKLDQLFELRQRSGVSQQGMQ